MSFIQRYQNGETEQVYADIHNLGKAAFSEAYFDDVQAVIQETMKRVAYNLEIIYRELENIGYNFKRNATFSFEKPLLKPFSDADNLLAALKNAISPFDVPLSLKLFYATVGSCNFAWDYETNADIPWKCADPLQIIPLNDLLEQVTDEYWAEEMTEHQQQYGTAYLELSADYYHKDDISGGPAYAIELTPKPSIDGRLLNEEHQTTFINYLRIVIFENCGFGRTEQMREDSSFNAFYESVKPKLKAI